MVKKQAPFTRRQLTPDRTLATGAVGFELRAVCDDPAANGKMIDTKLRSSIISSRFWVLARIHSVPAHIGQDHCLGKMSAFWN